MQHRPALPRTRPKKWETYRLPRYACAPSQAAMKSTLKEQMQACCLVTFCSAELPHVTAPHRRARPSTDTDSLPVPHTGLNSDAHDADRQVFVAMRVTSVTKTNHHSAHGADALKESHRNSRCRQLWVSMQERVSVLGGHIQTQATRNK
jgi:hypothetical protein